MNPNPVEWKYLSFCKSKHWFFETSITFAASLAKLSLQTEKTSIKVAFGIGIVNFPNKLFGFGSITFLL